MKILTIFIFGTCILDPLLLAEQAIEPQSNEAIESLIQAVRQAAKPSSDFSMKWVHETVTPHGLVLIVPGAPPPRPIPYEVREYSAVISGIRARVETLKKTYETGEKKEAISVSHITAVFDGTKGRKFVDRIKGVKTTPVGWQYERDKVGGLFAEELLGWPFNLSYGQLIKRGYTFELLDSPGPGIYLLQIIKSNGSIHHITIDGNRGFNVLKWERFRKPGDIDYSINYKLKQYDNGLWHISERESIRYPIPGKQGEPRVEYRVRVTDAKFDIEVPDDTFQVQFPSGTKVWDDTLRMWFIFGVDDQPIFEDSLIDQIKPDSNPEAGRKCRAISATETSVSGTSSIEEETERTTSAADSKPASLPWFVFVVGGLLIIVLFFAVAKARMKQKGDES